MLRQFYYKLPPQYRFLFRRLTYLPIDIFEKITGQRPPMTPPKGYIYTGSGDFVASGDKWLVFFREKGLKPNHQFLDIGSGIGRIARALTQYLNHDGHYEGFDAVAFGVKWCQKNIASSHPNFNFQYIPLGNDLYRNDGQKADNLVFPYAEKAFDFAVLISVFTHMLPEEVDNYVAQIFRILKNGGTCVATFFILTDEKITNPHFQFPHNYGHYALMDKAVKGANVAFDAAFLEKIILEKGLVISEKINGFWRTGTRTADKQDFQDVWVIKKG